MKKRNQSRRIIGRETGFSGGVGGKGGDVLEFTRAKGLPC